VYAFVVGFNEWVLKGWVAGQGWKRSKSKDANGWEHDGQIIRELKAPEALAAMSGRNCRQLQYPGKHDASVERGPGSGR